jgi:hypothetical protein
MLKPKIININFENFKALPFVSTFFISKKPNMSELIP